MSLKNKYYIISSWSKKFHIGTGLKPLCNTSLSFPSLNEHKVKTNEYLEIFEFWSDKWVLISDTTDYCKKCLKMLEKIQK